MRPLLPLLLLLLARADAAEWFVAPNGNDTWTGHLAAPNAQATDGPFATLDKARAAVRAEKGPRTVSLRAGTYSLPIGFTFGPEDSGTAEAPVVWQAFSKEHPVLIGGRAITNWQPGTNGIREANIGAQWFQTTGLHDLYFDGQRQPLARYPNYDPQNPYGGGWAYADGVMSPMYSEIEGENKHTLAVKAQDWRTWARPQDVEVFVFPRYNWWNDILPVKAVDAEKHTITTAKDGSYGMRPNDRYFFQGALEELDAPGEWYLDRQAGILHFKPPTDGPLDGHVFVPTTADILKLEGTKYLTLRGLTLECASDRAVVLKETAGCRIIACTIRNVGTGISVSGTDNGVIGCDISETGVAGVSLNGGDIKTLSAAGNFAENCYLHHVGVQWKRGPGVSLTGVGQRVSHCLIHDTPRFAIQYTGNDHIIEYNHLRHIALETEDVGATYSGGRDWLSPRGTVIRYNYIHDVMGFGWNGKWTSPFFAWGIYLDDNSGGVDVIGNIVARCGRSLIHGHSARDCVVDNNIFIEGGQRQWEFNGWTTSHRFWTDHLPTMTKGYDSVANEPAWKAMRGMSIPPRRDPRCARLGRCCG